MNPITSLTLADGGSKIVQAQPKDAQNNPGVINSAPSWNSSDPTVATVGNVSADGLAATITAVAPGSCNITCNGNSAAGNFSSALPTTVTGGPATSFGFSA